MHTSEVLITGIGLHLSLQGRGAAGNSRSVLQISSEISDNEDYTRNDAGLLEHAEYRLKSVGKLRITIKYRQFKPCEILKHTEKTKKLNFLRMLLVKIVFCTHPRESNANLKTIVFIKLAIQWKIPYFASEPSASGEISIVQASFLTKNHQLVQPLPWRPPVLYKIIS